MAWSSENQHTRAMRSEAVPAPQFRSIRRSPAAADEAIATIKEMILGGELVARQRLPSEKQLAEALGVSRPTMREAIRGLLTLNILESRHGDGTYVTSLEPELLAAPLEFLMKVDGPGLASVLETRRILEPAMAGLAAERASEDDLARLDAVILEYDAALDDIDRCIALDEEFHGIVAGASRNHFIASTLSTLSLLALESRRRTAADRRVRTRSSQDHRDILAALRSGSPEAAQQAMDAHLLHVVTPGR